MAIPITLKLNGAKNHAGAKINSNTIPRTLPNKNVTHITSSTTPATINTKAKILDISKFI
jgi:hypothetical protein